MLPTLEAVSCVLCHATVSVRKGNRERFLSHINHDHEVHYDKDLLYALSFMTEQEKQTVVLMMEKRMEGSEEAREETVILDTSTDNSTETEAAANPEENLVKPERKPSSKSQCPHCELMVSKKSLKVHLLKKHKISSPGLRRYTACQFCDKMMRKDSLRRHLRQVHASSKEDQQSQEVTKIKTEVWEQVNADSSSEVEVEGKKQRKCKICFKTVRVSGYSRHLKEKHSGIIHKCKLCHVRLGRKHYIKKHMESVHKNDKHLLDHQLNPTFSKNDCKFDCPECGIKLISAEIREFHVAKSHGTGREQCENCGRRFRNKPSLRKHQDNCTVLSVNMP